MYIITIGREFGSGGHEIATKLSEKLNFKLFDKEIIDKTAEKNNVSNSLVEFYDEQPIPKSIFPIKTDAIDIIDKNIPLEQQIFIAEKQTMLEVAKENNCIFVGRCGNYIFREHEDAVSFFIIAPLNFRIRRKMKQLNLPYHKVKKLIIKTDKSRSEYYNFNTGSKWLDTSKYNYILNSAELGIDGCVDKIISILKEKGVI